MTADLMVIGASAAATAYLERLRELGCTAPITVVDADADAPYDRPPLSKHFLVDGIIEDIRTDWADLDVTLVRAEAIGVEPKDRQIRLRTLNGAEEVLSYGQLVIATGALPIRLPVEPADTYVLRSSSDAQRLREATQPGQQMTIIGAGAIGVELASSLRSLGAGVTLLDRAPGPLERLLAGHLAEELTDWLEDYGVDCRWNADIRSIEHLEGGWVVDVAGAAPLRSDLVVSAVGARPAVAWLGNSGLLTGGTLLVDDEGHVLVGDLPVEDVYAMGDAVSRREGDGTLIRTESWTAARLQGTRLAEHMLGEDHERTESPYFWTEVADRKVQVVGNLHPQADINIESENPERRSTLYRVKHDDNIAWIGINAQPRIARLLMVAAT